MDLETIKHTEHSVDIYFSFLLSYTHTHTRDFLQVFKCTASRNSRQIYTITFIKRKVKAWNILPYTDIIGILLAVRCRDI